MDVDEDTAQWTSEHEGKMYYFCAPGCKVIFENDPPRYADQDQPSHGHNGYGGHNCCGH